MKIITETRHAHYILYLRFYCGIFEWRRICAGLQSYSKLPLKIDSFPVNVFLNNRNLFSKSLIYVGPSSFVVLLTTDDLMIAFWDLDIFVFLQNIK
jgi:hypothetical protein